MKLWRKLLAHALVVTAVLGIVGCQRGRAGALGPSSDKTPSLKFELADLRLGMAAPEVQKVMGEPERVVKNGDASYRWDYDALGVTILFMPWANDTSAARVYEVRQTKGAGPLGLAVGDNQQVVERKSGKTVGILPAAGYEGVRLAEMDGSTLDIEVRDGKVTAFMLSGPWGVD